MPQRVAQWNDTFGDALADDDHVFGGSLYTMPLRPGGKTFGTPAALLPSQGENNYYPGYSPDGQFIVFNRVPAAGDRSIAGRPIAPAADAAICPNDSFSNPKARVMLLSTKPGAMPIDLENANGSPAAAPVDAVELVAALVAVHADLQGRSLLWVTFSSTRDYGLRVRNHKAGMFQCYPADSYRGARRLARHDVRRRPASSRRSGWRRSTCRTAEFSTSRSVVPGLLAAVPGHHHAQPHGAVDADRRRPAAARRGRLHPQRRRLHHQSERLLRRYLHRLRRLRHPLNQRARFANTVGVRESARQSLITPHESPRYLSEHDSRTLWCLRAAPPRCAGAQFH